MLLNQSSCVLNGSKWDEVDDTVRMAKFCVLVGFLIKKIQSNKKSMWFVNYVKFWNRFMQISWKPCGILDNWTKMYWKFAIR